MLVCWAYASTLFEIYTLTCFPCRKTRTPSHASPWGHSLTNAGVYWQTPTGEKRRVVVSIYVYGNGSILYAMSTLLRYWRANLHELFASNTEMNGSKTWKDNFRRSSACFLYHATWVIGMSAVIKLSCNVLSPLISAFEANNSWRGFSSTESV